MSAQGVGLHTVPGCGTGAQEASDPILATTVQIISGSSKIQ